MKDIKTAAFVILDKYLDATDEMINKELIVKAMIEYAELRLTKENKCQSCHVTEVIINGHCNVCGAEQSFYKLKK